MFVSLQFLTELYPSSGAIFVDMQPGKRIFALLFMLSFMVIYVHKTEIMIPFGGVRFILVSVSNR
jgi:hypothetical protein